MNIHDELLGSLQELDRTIRQSYPAGERPNLLPLFERIDALTLQLPRGTDPALMHYLHKKSYEKARLYLEGRDADNQAGNCGHV